ncbi:MAG: hypothetical protein IJJ11_07140 [Methanosphaera sp.]|nr:hypothetical protein [Methanosphaera sp.]MBR3214716.1 hypothetical protein [Methanosphaera sp.]
MDATIRIDLDIQRQLKLKSVELGITQKELANIYILNGLNEEKNNGNMKTIDDIAKTLNININDPNTELDDLDEDTFEIVSDKNKLTMDEIKEIVEKNKSDKESNVKLSDMLGIVESPDEIDCLNEKWESYDRR